MVPSPAGPPPSSLEGAEVAASLTESVERARMLYPYRFSEKFICHVFAESNILFFLGSAEPCRVADILIFRALQVGCRLIAG